MLIYPSTLQWQSKINANDSAAQTAAHARACLDRAAPSLWPRVAAKLDVRGPEHEPVVFAQSRGFVCRGGGRHLPVPLPGMTGRVVDSCTGPAFIITCCISRYLWCLCVAGSRCTPRSLLLSLGSGRKRVCRGRSFLLLLGSVGGLCSDFVQFNLALGMGMRSPGSLENCKVASLPFSFFLN